ncbi:MAG: AroM family protein [Caldilineaceae bacterium]
MSTAQFAIRPATPTDLPQIIAADAAVFGWYSAQEDPTVIAARLQVFPQGCIVLEADGAFAGYATSEKWSSLREPALDENPHETHDARGPIFNITTLAVLPDQQRGGLGKALLVRLIEIARAEGCTQIVLETAHAEAWYARHGFFKLAERTQRGIRLPIMTMRLTRPRIGALVIGQSPRPDLVDPLRQALPQADVIEVGALDELTAAELPAVEGAAYPLTTRLRNGERVMVAEAFLAPRLQMALDRAEERGVHASILLCAGSFANLRGARPLFKPFDTARAVLRSLGIQRIGVLCPIPEQEAPIGARWRGAGFDVHLHTAPPDARDASLQQWLAQNRGQIDCVLLDYVGHPPDTVNELQRQFGLPVLDLGQLAIQALAAVWG